MSQENVKPEQIQASVAAALSRLRGDLAPPSDESAALPSSPPASPTPAATINMPPRLEPVQPANDLRAEPAFKPIPSGLSPQAPTAPEAASEPELPRAMFSRPRPAQRFGSPTVADAPTVQRVSGPLARMMAREAVPAMEEPIKPAEVAAAAPTPASADLSPPSSLPPLSPPSMLSSDQQPDLLAGLPPPPLSDALTDDVDVIARRRRRNRRILMASVAIVIVAGGVSLWRSGGSDTADVPVIAAETTPDKIKPADEGGMQVPNQNVQVLDNMDSSQPPAEGETVMPAPEQPVTPPAPTVVETQPSTEPTAEATATDTTSATLQDVPDTVTPETPPAPAAESSTADAAPAVPPASEPTQSQEATAAPEPEPAPAPVAVAEPAPTPEPTQPAPAATQEAAVTPTPAPVAGNARIQLAAVKSEDAAKVEWAKLQKSYPDLLGSLTLTVQRVDKGAAGIFYRIQAGPLADKAAAKELCASLKQRSQDCLVAK